jgi:hypothetical protein
VLSGDTTIVAAEDRATYEITGVVSDTELTLSAPYGGATYAGVDYVVHRDFFPNAQPLMKVGELETIYITNYANRKSVPVGDIGTAGFLDAQTSDADTALGKLVLTDSLGDNGGPIFTTANLNVNKWNATALGEPFGVGVAISTTICFIFININAIVRPLSIATAGTFRLYNLNNGSTADTGILNTDVLFNSSSNRVIRARVNAVGLVAGNAYELQAESSTSDIEY